MLVAEIKSRTVEVRPRLLVRQRRRSSAKPMAYEGLSHTQKTW
jgi:hypothetical protein